MRGHKSDSQKYFMINDIENGISSYSAVLR